MTKYSFIHGIGTFLPATKLTNDDISLLVDTSDEWIRTRTGIVERRLFAEDESPVAAACEAAKKALEAAHMTVDKVTHVLVSTCTPEYLCPSTACRVAGALGCANTVMPFDFNAACTGFVYGLSLTHSLIAAHTHACQQEDAVVLLICVEALTRRINWQDRSTAVLFGDGACALVLSGSAKAQSLRVSDVACRSDGSLWELISIGGGTKKKYAVGESIDEDFFVHMQGREVFKHAVRNLTSVCTQVVERNGLRMEDVDCFVPHQANLRIIEAVGQRLSLPPHKVFTNVQQYGNTSSVSVPLALFEVCEQKPSAKHILVAAVGAGFTWGAALLERV